MAYVLGLSPVDQLPRLINRMHSKLIALANATMHNTLNSNQYLAISTGSRKLTVAR
jgi:hypothetical protein